VAFGHKSKYDQCQSAFLSTGKHFEFCVRALSRCP